MNVEPIAERLAQRRNIGNLGQQPQLDLRVVGRDELRPRVRDEGAPDLAPLLGRIGMFCRFGSDDDNRPVVVDASA